MRLSQSKPVRKKRGNRAGHQSRLKRLTKLFTLAAVTAGVGFHIHHIVKRSELPNSEAIRRETRVGRQPSTVDFLVANVKDENIRKIVERLRGAQISMPIRSVFPTPETMGLLTFYRTGNQTWVENEQFPVNGSLQRALYVALLSQTPYGAHLSEKNPSYNPRRIHNVNIPPEGFNQIEFIPVPQPYSQRVLSTELAIESSVEALYYFLESQTVPDEYKKLMRELIKLKGVEFVVTLSVAVMRAETLDGNQQTQLTRYEPRYGEYSFGYHQILFTGPGRNTLLRLGLNPDDLNSPINSALAFYTFLFEKGGRGIVEILKNVKNPSNPDEWREFARFYNGGGYVANNYHRKLAHHINSIGVSGEPNTPVVDDRFLQPNSPQEAVQQFLNMLQEIGVLRKDETVSVVVRHGNREVVAVNKDVKLPIASMVKIFVAWAYLRAHEIDPTRYPLDDDIMNQLKRMVRLSDNQATNRFIKKLGGPEAVQKFLCLQLPENIHKGVSITSYIPPGGAEYKNSATGSSLVEFMCHLITTQNTSLASQMTIYLMHGSRERMGTIIPDEISFNLEKTGTTGKTVGSVGVCWIDRGNGLEPVVFYVNCVNNNRTYNNPEARRIRVDLVSCVFKIVMHGISIAKNNGFEFINNRESNDHVELKETSQKSWVKTSFFSGLLAGLVGPSLLRRLLRSRRSKIGRRP